MSRGIALKGITDIDSSSAYSSAPEKTTQSRERRRSDSAIFIDRVRPGASASLNSKPVALTLQTHEQVELGAAVSGPEVSVTGAEHADNLFESEAFPRCTELRLRLEIRERSDLRSACRMPCHEGRPWETSPVVCRHSRTKGLTRES